MAGADPVPVHVWLNDACASFNLRDKEVAHALGISRSLWEKIRAGRRALQYVQRQRFKLLLKAIADPAEYARWLAVEPPAYPQRLRQAS